MQVQQGLRRRQAHREYGLPDAAGAAGAAMEIVNTADPVIWYERLVQRTVNAAGMLFYT